jgi:small subunit ribosomal protein S16
MLKIRLQRVGRKHDPNFRVVLMESKSAATSGKVNEVLGTYEPRRKAVELKKDRIEYWRSKGAQMTVTVKSLYDRSSDWKPKSNEKPSKKKQAKAAAAAEAPKEDASVDVSEEASAKEEGPAKEEAPAKNEAQAEAEK